MRVKADARVKTEGARGRLLLTQNQSSEFRREGALDSVLGRLAARYRIGQPSPTFENTHRG